MNSLAPLQASPTPGPTVNDGATQPRLLLLARHTVGHGATSCRCGRAAVATVTAQASQSLLSPYVTRRPPAPPHRTGAREKTPFWLGGGCSCSGALFIAPFRWGLWSTRSEPHREVQSFSIPVGSFTIHPWIRTRQHCTARKGDSSVFCTKKEGYLGVCQATQRVDSTGERLYRAASPAAPNLRLDSSQFPPQGGSYAERSEQP